MFQNLYKLSKTQVRNFMPQSHTKFRSDTDSSIATFSQLSENPLFDLRLWSGPGLILHVTIIRVFLFAGQCPAKLLDFLAALVKKQGRVYFVTV